MKRIAVVFALLLFMGLALGGTAAAAPEAIFTVNQTADLADARLSDNRCDTSLSLSGDQCSLRAAIQQANFTAGTDTIRFVSSATHGLTRVGADDTALAGDLDITASVNIEGRAPHTTVDANGIDRVFHIIGGAVSIANLIVQDGHTAGFGGGFQVNAGAQLALNDTIVRNNFAADNSGGIENFGTLALNRVSIESNSTNDYIGGLRSTGNLTMQDSAVVNNLGAAAVLVGSSTILNSTLTGMNVVGLVSLRNVTTGGLVDCDPSFGCGNANTTNLFNTIVGSCHGTYSSLGYNLVENASECTLTGNQAGNLLNQDARLAALGQNGGPTLTRALLADSPAIDAGNPAGCAGLNGVTLTSDQRGFPRPTDGDGDGTPRCDIGAFETGAVGIGGLAPRKGSSGPGAEVVFDLDWVSPTRWRNLHTVDLRFARDGQKILWLRFTEGLPASTFSLLDAHGAVIASGAAGEARVLTGEFGALDLAQSGFSATGPNDPHVVIHYAVSFKAKAQGKLRAQVSATDDFGNRQPWEPKGRWRVNP